MSVPSKPNGIRGFVVLVAVVILGGIVLWSHGDLISPLQSSALLLSLSGSEPGFAMVGEAREAPAPAAASADTSQAAAEDASLVIETAPAAPMTLETLAAELSAAGVDITALTAQMNAEGRGLENLLAVVNSGRVTVAELAARLQNTQNAPAAEAQVPPSEVSAAETGLFDLRWEEIGSVAYDLWFMLAMTVVVIVVARPVGWLVNRLRRSSTASA